MDVTNIACASSDFSTNRHAAKPQEVEAPTRHSNICFDDGNLAVLTGSQYCLVHQGVLSRRSDTLRKLIKKTLEGGEPENVRFLEGCPVLHLQDPPDDLGRFLQALYDGISCLVYDGTSFSTVAGLLRLFTKYHVNCLREEALRGLSVSWPTTLSQWESREAKATDANGIYAPRHVLPHPILVIELARKINATELLPSAFYDLSRSPPSLAAIGYLSPTTAITHQLSEPDLLSVLRGREHASRFLSTFIVNELEGREPSEWCLHRHKEQANDRRTCQIAFEAITFELLRDVNGVVCNRNSDPLYAIQDAELMQTRDDLPGTENKAAYRACEACRSEFGAVVDMAREEFWRKVPQWFGVEVSNWG